LTQKARVISYSGCFLMIYIYSQHRVVNARILRNNQIHNLTCSFTFILALQYSDNIILSKSKGCADVFMLLLNQVTVFITLLYFYVYLS
jgi:hypothetical protein